MSSSTVACGMPWNDQNSTRDKRVEGLLTQRHSWVPSQRFLEHSFDVVERGSIFPMGEPLKSFADNRINLSLSPCLHFRVQNHRQHEDHQRGTHLLRGSVINGRSSAACKVGFVPFPTQLIERVSDTAWTCIREMLTHQRRHSHKLL